MKKIYLIAGLSFSLLAVTNTALAQGETCATAVVVTPGTYNADGPATGSGCNNCASSANADWYSFTATATGTIDINSCGGNGDTRLFVYDGACGSLNQLATNDDACDLGTGDEWASEIIGISVVAGTTYYFEWDDRWEDTPFSWSFSFNAAPSEDIEALAVTGLVYTMVPVSQIDPAGYTLSASIRNNGLSDVSDAVLTVNVYDLPNPTPIQTATSATTNVVSLATVPVTAGTFNPTGAGTFLLEYIVSSASITDANISNDTLTTAIIIDSTYARDNASITGSVTGTLGIGAGTSGELGQNFTLLVQDTLTSVDVFMGNTATPPMTGELFSVKIYNVDGTGKPTTVFGSTDVITKDTATNVMLTLPLTAPLVLPAGEYAFIAQEPSAANSTIGTTTGILAPGKTWVNFPGSPSGDWANNESFGFNVVFVLRPIFGTVPTSTGVSELSNATFSVYPNPATENVLVNNVVKGSTLEVVNTLGQVVYSEVVDNSKTNINVAEFNNGLYVIRITNENEVITNTFVKQ